VDTDFRRDKREAFARGSCSNNKLERDDDSKISHPAPASSTGKRFMPDIPPQQLLHLVIGGELTDLEHTTFKNLDEVEVVGVFPNYATALVAWKAKAQQTVDNAQMRYFIVHLHRLLDPGQDAKPGA
jgi:Domain of unknown function (DUF4170)